MKKIYSIILVAILLAGCRKDKGNYDYSNLDELSIAIPFENYQVAIGGQLSIDPNITTAIDNQDLSYQWEIGGVSPSVEGYYTFLPLSPQKKLDYVFNLAGTIKGPGNYNIRLTVTQKSNNRKFYSPVIGVSLTSDYTGLVVLHGNDLQSDIGLIQANDFLVRPGNIATKINTSLFSTVNKKKIDGKGISVIQTITNFLTVADRASVVAITDKGAAVIRYTDFSNTGDWNSLFNIGINSGKPEFYSTQDQIVYAVDNGKIFPRNNNSYSIFPAPSPAVTSFNAGSPFFLVPTKNQGFFFDKDRKGFIRTTNLIAFTGFSSAAGTSFAAPQTTRLFNVGNMGASLLYIDRGGLTNQFMAVMKNSDNTKFLAQMNWSASADGNIPVARYDMEVLPQISQAKYFAFGDDQPPLCFYATPSKVYRYTALSTDAVPSLSGKSNELRTENGAAISFDGEITMLKVLKPLKNTSGSLQVNYQFYNKVLLVGTYNNGKGTLYALRLNEATGDVVSYNTYTGFDKIYDANLKGL